MYVSTFYSFKGGVGRTQALVNVGAELARRGKRVLLVDFDLEAPGIDTFFRAHQPSPKGGMVEYVTDFMKSGSASDVRDYIVDVALESVAPGSLFMMPAGNQNDEYSRRLASIDWPTLYAHHNGYLLFEDLKLQWERALQVDYVLIDSRTGHTDVGGICTRQLPDSVTILFLPNDQNLHGLPKVVQDIRAEAQTARHKRIDILFVMSNVPDLDDEEHILERRRSAFAKSLGYSDLTATIHRYDSLSLLDQVVFTLRRPSTRLAQQFKVLADKITRLNVLDREGARAFIEGISRGEKAFDADEIDARLERIRLAHANDGEVLQMLAALRLGEARFEDALPLLNQIIDTGRATPSVRLRRAEALLVTGRAKEASADIEALLESSQATEQEITRAIRLLRQADRNSLATVGRRIGVRALRPDARIRIAASLALESESQQAAVDILQSVLFESGHTLQQQQAAREELGMALIGVGAFVEAVRELEQTNLLSIRNRFNLAMADWAAHGNPSITLFQHVLELHEKDPMRDDPNYEQCIAMALALTARAADAVTHIHTARRVLSAQPLHPFSCWRYSRVSAVEFIEDLDEMMRLTTGSVAVPVFMRRSAGEQQSSVDGPPNSR